MSQGQHLNKLHQKRDVIVALGNPEALEHIDVVILPNEVETMESATQTLYVGSKSEDKTLGLLALWIDASGELTNHYATEIALTGEVDESETIRQLLTDFYLSTAEENKTVMVLRSLPINSWKNKTVSIFQQILAKVATSKNISNGQQRATHSPTKRL